jgi:hypothetical protein
MPTTIPDALIAPGGDRPGEPVPWGASFLVNGQLGRPIPLEQVTAKDFELQGTLEYHGDMGLPADRYPAITAEMRDRARRVDGGTSDLASVPRFLRWFENTYGRHTPAALIHDNLICPTPNGGPLESDAASDRFFRYMLEAVGVPFVKRWIMWAAVAFRTRWSVGGWRRRSVAAWVVLAALGITAFVWAVIAIATGNDGPGGLDHWAFLGLALAAPLVATPLWGKQWGASLVTAAAAPFVLPPAGIAAIGYAVYWLLERLARALHL